MTSLVNGFMTYSSAPASMARIIWDISVSVVTITILMSLKAGLARTLFKTSRPFISGMFQSSSINAGGSTARNFRRASCPWMASQVSKPMSRSMEPRMDLIALESSTIMTRIDPSGFRFNVLEK